MPIHPVRNGAHFDRPNNGLSERAVFKQGFCGTDRLVVAHVLIYGECNARALTGFYGFHGFGVIHPERFLRQNAFDGFSRARSFDER